MNDPSICECEHPSNTEAHECERCGGWWDGYHEEPLPDDVDPQELLEQWELRSRLDDGRN